MSTETSRSLVGRLYEEVLNKRSLEVIDQIAVEDYIENDPMPGQGEGRSGLRDRVSMLVTALDPSFTVEDVIAEGDRVVVRWRNRGTHVEPFLGLPASGKPFDIAGIDIYRVEGGRLAEHWHVVDQLALLMQLGFIPAPETASP
ncbi:ester cyclase [Sinomonas sp. JGH33]|uniref:Ester cyclase n=1 Tax=Sinomonas terricola TaxID=3110330 RepID=A0ABU5T218_9MICC|nr:ester cyclase [Sinomonas sp. JGH33]MEA5453536.1 ester cyclase [Sinomonas sp. JGH33]